MTTPGPLRRIAATATLAIATLLAMAAPLVFVLALPPFAFGIWFQTEPVTAGVLAAGAAAAICLLLLNLTGHPVAVAMRRRSMLVMAAFIGWNALASCFQHFPFRSWFGTPETGEGILAYMALWTLALLAQVLWAHRWPRYLLAATAAVVALVLAADDALLPMGSPWRPQLVAGYAGTIAPAVLLLIVATTRQPRRWLVYLGLAITLPLTASSFIISHTDGRYLNRSAVVFAVFLAPAVFFPLRFTLLRLQPRAARIVAACVPLLSLLVLAAMLLPSVMMRDLMAVYSLRSRALLILAAFQGLADRALNWLWGTGWGSYNDLLYRHAYLGSVSGFRNGVWNPDWEALGAGAFNSHSAVVEALTGGGMPAALLYLGVICCIVRDTRRPLLAGSAVVWLLILASLCVWYPFVMSFPFLALAVGAAISPPRPPALRRSRYWPGAVALGLAAVLAWGCQATVQDARNGGALLAMANRQSAVDLHAFHGQPDDHGRGGTHLWWVALNYSNFLIDRLQKHEPVTEAQLAWYARLLDEVDRWTAEGRAGLRLRALTVSMRNDIEALEQTPTLAPLQAREQPKWRRDVIDLLRDAPLRTDVAAPYLTWLAAGQHALPMLAFCNTVFSLRPFDPICLWFGGYAMLSDPMTQRAGILQMRDALRAGVERIAPITPDARRSVERQAAAVGQ